MSDLPTPLSEFIDRIPPPRRIRDRLAENLRENRLLRQLLRMSEQREKVGATEELAGKEVRS